jgi:hypothetical protein
MKIVELHSDSSTMTPPKVNKSGPIESDAYCDLMQKHSSRFKITQPSKTLDHKVAVTNYMLNGHPS